MRKLASRKDTRVIDLLIAYGPLGYGIYALLVEYLKERKAFRSMDDINRIAYELHADADILRAIITDFNLFEIIEGEITHKVIERKAPAVKEISESSEHSEYSGNSECALAEAPESEVDIPVPEPAISASAKRRARRKRLRDYRSHPLIN